MTVLVDGQRANAVDGMHVGFAERLAAHQGPVGCVDCGGPAPQGSALTKVSRFPLSPVSSGYSAWRRCADCVELRRIGLGAVVRDVLEVHGVGPAEGAPWSAVRPALRAHGLPYWHLQEPPQEEFAAPVERWQFPGAASWAVRFRDRVRRELSLGATR